MSKARELIGEMEPDFLVYNNQPTPDVKTVKLAAGQGVLDRGTVIAFTETAPDTAGVIWSDTTNLVADCVLCDKIDTGKNSGGPDVVAGAYRTAHLCRQALKLGGSASKLTPIAERQLRYAGILLSNAVI